MVTIAKAPNGAMYATNGRKGNNKSRRYEIRDGKVYFLGTKDHRNDIYPYPKSITCETTLQYWEDCRGTDLRGSEGQEFSCEVKGTRSDTHPCTDDWNHGLGLHSEVTARDVYSDDPTEGYSLDTDSLYAWNMKGGGSIRWWVETKDGRKHGSGAFTAIPPSGLHIGMSLYQGALSFDVYGATPWPGGLPLEPVPPPPDKPWPTAPWGREVAADASRRPKENVEDNGKNMAVYTWSQRWDSNGSRQAAGLDLNLRAECRIQVKVKFNY